MRITIHEDYAIFLRDLKAQNLPQNKHYRTMKAYLQTLPETDVLFIDISTSGKSCDYTVANALSNLRAV